MCDHCVKGREKKKKRCNGLSSFAISDSGNVTECLRALADRHHATLHQLEVDNAHVTNEGVGVLPLLTCELVWLCVF